LNNDGITQIHVPAFNFNNFEGLSLVDTTGAGDAFTGGFATGLLENNGEFAEVAEKAMKLGTQSAFLTITRYGAGPAIPSREEISRL
jgi:ribokinase